MKLCRTCGIAQPLECFSKKGVGRRSQCKSCNKHYYDKNREKLVAWARNYYKENKATLLVKSSAYQKARKKVDPDFKVRANFRARLHNALNGVAKYQTTMELLGCSIAALRAHLQAQFTTNMSWDNCGKWHIDHIKPCAKFDLTKEAEQKACFHYSNLQPLWAKDNMKKSDNFPAIV